MRVDIDEVVESVLIKLDESPDLLDEAIEYGSPQFDLRELIRNIIVEAAEAVIISADRESFGEWLPLSGAVRRIGEGSSVGQIFRVPDDFMRLIYLRMSDWTVGVTELVSTGDVSVSLRRHWLSRGCDRVCPPFVTMGYHDGERALEIFGSVAGSRVAEGGYIPRPRVEEENKLFFPPSLKHLLTDKLVNIIKEIRK